ncbi:MAG: hypothetical protein ACLFVU_10905 [Phycisphaerae bacterium]
MELPTCKVIWDDIEWESPQPGLRQKARVNGRKRFRLVLLHPDYSPADWCETGHIGLVLEGDMTVEFETGQEAFKPGEGMFILSGMLYRHKFHPGEGGVQLLLVEDS